MTKRFGVAADDIMKEHKIRPSAHRQAIGHFVLFTDTHPTADEVYDMALANFPTMSRATVYNTLNLFVARGLLKQTVKNGHIAYERNLKPHHHFIDEETGQIYDVDHKDIRVQAQDLRNLPGLDVRSYTIVMTGRVVRPPRKPQS